MTGRTQRHRFALLALAVASGVAGACADSHAKVPAGTHADAGARVTNPVRRLYFSGGPLQFVAPTTLPGALSDSAQRLPLVALDADGREVDSYDATVIITDSSVVSFDGIWLRPKSPGGTVLGAVVAGGPSADHGVSAHVYARLRTIDDMRPDQRWVSVPVSLSAGEMVRWSLPPVRWMLTMMPYEDSLSGLRLRIEHANCARMGVTARRYTCLAGPQASVVIYHPGTPELARTLTGELLIYREDRDAAVALRTSAR